MTGSHHLDCDFFNVLPESCEVEVRVDGAVSPIVIPTIIFVRTNQVDGFSRVGRRSVEQMAKKMDPPADAGGDLLSRASPVRIIRNVGIIGRGELDRSDSEKEPAWGPRRLLRCLEKGVCRIRAGQLD